MKNNLVNNFVKLFFKKSSKDTKSNIELENEVPSYKFYSESDPIELLSLNYKIQLLLKNKGLDTVGKFYRYKRKRLKKIKHIGPKTLKYLMKIKHEIRLSNLDVKNNIETNPIPDNSNEAIMQYKNIMQDSSNADTDQINPSRSVFRNDRISVLNLPTRLENSLLRAGIETIGQFYDYDEKTFFRIRNIGHKSQAYLSRIKKELDVSPETNTPEEPIKEVESKSDFTENKPKESIEDVFSKANLEGSDPIETLGLPTRIENALKAAGINTLNLLFLSTEKEIVESRNLGHRSLELITKYKDAIRKGIITGIQDEELVDVTLNRCKDEREKMIISKRYGLFTGERETLEEIGENLNITRERVRQIQNKTLSRMRHPSTKSKQRLKELIAKVCLENGGIITDREADNLMPKLVKNSSIDGSSFLDLVADLGWIQKHKVSDTSFYSSNNSNFPLSQLMESIISIIKIKHKALSVEEIMKAMALDSNQDSAMISNIVTKCCNSDPRIEKIEEKYTLYSFPSSITNKWAYFISKVLEESGEPLHFTEIAERVNKQLSSVNEKLEQRRVYAILIQKPQFAHTGSWGMYGLTKWGLRKESTLDLAEEYIRKAGFPVHWEQIYNYVSKYKYTKPGNIVSILNSGDRFVRVGRGMYWVKNEKNN